MVNETRETKKIESDFDQLDWKNEDPRMLLSSLYALTIERMQSELNWYEKLIPRVRWGSYALRALSLIFLVFGVIAPLLGIIAFSDADAASQLKFSYAGYTGLALAGILFSIDKFFVVSKTWMRYISAKLILEKKLLDFRFRWQKYQAEIKGAEIGLDKQKLIIEDFREFVADIMDEVIKETGVWQSDLEKGLKELSDKLNASSRHLDAGISHLQKQKRKT